MCVDRVNLQFPSVELVQVGVQPLRIEALSPLESSVATFFGLTVGIRL